MRKSAVLFICFAVCLLLSACVHDVPSEEAEAYAKAQNLFDQGQYEAAIEAFTALGEYKDSKYILSEIRMAQAYEEAMQLVENKAYQEAFAKLSALGEYKDVQQQMERFQIVKITPENWQEYFEFVTEPVYGMRDTGEYERVDFRHSFQMKEEVFFRVYDPERNIVEVTIDFTEQNHNFYLDPQTGAYEFIAFEDPFSGKPISRTAELSITAEERSEEIGSALYMAGKEFDGTPYCWCEKWQNFAVRTIEGYLYLYQ